MPRRLVLIGFGTALNICLVSLPLLIDTDKISVVANFQGIITYLLIAFFCIGESAASFRASNQPLQSTRHELLPYASGISFLLLCWTALFDNRSINSAGSLSMVIAGCTVFLLGLSFRLAAIKSLGLFFTSHIGVTCDHHLVTTGVYRHIRHPSELGLMLISVSLAIIMNSKPALLGAFCVITPLSVLRICLEDALLANQFAEDFRRYKESVPALFVRFKFPHLRTSQHFE